jgi:transposase
MMSLNKCPGLDKFRNPEITEKTCPVCGETIELFSVDTSVACDKCGFVAYNDTKSCISWCKYAKDCFGPELYDKLVTSRQANK